MSAEAEPRPIFHPKGWRPARDEQWEMKQAVIARDGVTDCFWCRTPFASAEDATLEHIVPLLDGGRHDLRNCTLACIECNLKNEPRAMVARRVATQTEKAIRSAANRAANGGEAEDCDATVSSRFATISRSNRAIPLTYATASFLLKNIHRQLNRPPPSVHEKHVFKGHFNRWLTGQANALAEKSPPQ